MPPRKPSAGGKLKRPLTEKMRAAAEHRLAHLRAHLRFHPLPPPQRPLAPDGSPQEAALRALGLLDFARLDLPSDALRPDLVSSLVAYYDPAQRRSFVRGVRVAVSRKSFADALCLPPKPASTAPPPDADTAAAGVAATLELMQAYVLSPFQGDDIFILPQEVAAVEQAMREGSAHRVDWAGLIWGLVEKEMLELPKRDDGLCYYGAYLQRLIWAQKPKLFEQTEDEDKGEVILEVSDMDEEDGDDGAIDLDAKNKSLVELESGDTNADVSSKSLDKLEAGGADLRSNGLEELELGNAGVRGNSGEELKFKIEDKQSNVSEDLAEADEDAEHMGLDESDAADEDVKSRSFDKSELGIVSIEAISVPREVMLANDEDTAEVAAERDEDISVAEVEKDAGPLAEAVLITEEEFVVVLEEDEEEADVDEENDTTGLSLGIGSANDYDRTDMEHDANVNLSEGDCVNEEAEEAEEDAFGKYRSDDVNWTMGDEKGDRSAFVTMEFENLNRSNVEIRSDVSYNDEFSGKLEAGCVDLRSNGLEELELGNACVRGNSGEELEFKIEDKRSKVSEDLAEADEDAEHMGLNESDAADEDVKSRSFDKSELGIVSMEAVSVTREVILANDEDTAEVAAERDEDTAVAEIEKDACPLAETVLITQEEFVAVPDEDEEEADGDEENDATGLSLGIGSASDYDSTDMEDDANVENLGEGDSDNEEAEEAEESEEDIFGNYRSNEVNWTTGDGKGDRSAFVTMEFENLNRSNVEIRNEVSYDDFSGKMGSLHGMTSINLLQAMSSVPATYNVSENVPDLSSGDFLAIGADAHKNGLDLAAGSSFFFENNGKRHIEEIEGYNDHMPGQEQFPQSNQHKRMRNSNNSSISPGSAVFNANFAEPFQNLINKASIFYEQKERELQDVLVQKQYLANLLQEKEQIIQSMNSASYRRALKQNRASFDEYRKKFPCDKPRYCDVPGGGGLVLSVKELERKQLEKQQQKLAVANEMIKSFEHEWFSKLDGWSHAIHFLWSRTEALSLEVNLLRGEGKEKVTIPAKEE
ncbi:hypothetical protein GUJ93_ZPchr0012g21301 [Zizania palustris]|uniref:Uncharacterized protein n=1 Tax=Zizania palustris TaxID=103762 RepID=A0A8J5WQG2_ZIZPA|nr:hypothetical protein GUJ93_ZPchr0012g21301 [Zizania palustris]KAG8094487.1 hypothetical protein GUJ93_ZPchr0012g21301 [Zizania palustris]